MEIQKSHNDLVEIRGCLHVTSHRRGSRSLIFSEGICYIGSSRSSSSETRVQSVPSPQTILHFFSQSNLQETILCLRERGCGKVPQLYSCTGEAVAYLPPLRKSAARESGSSLPVKPGCRVRPIKQPYLSPLRQTYSLSGAGGCGCEGR